MHTEERKRLKPRTIQIKDDSQKEGFKWITVSWCEICRGLIKGQVKCVICRQKSSAIRKAFPEVTEHCEYIRSTYKKMTKFRQPSTGIREIDMDIREQHGVVNAHRLLAEIQKYGDRYYTWLTYNHNIREVGNSPTEAKVHLAIKANAWNNTLSPNYKDYEWVEKEEFNLNEVKEQVDLRILK